MSRNGQQGAKRTNTPWPTAAQFNEAVQNLAVSMSDRELQAGLADVGPLGMPMPYAGNFADVYKVYCPGTGNTWAVKFFKREVGDLRDRYKAISEQLIIAQLPFTTDFRYVEEGVRIGGAWYPLVKMRWIEGLSLNRFVAQSLGQPKVLDQLFNLWVKLAGRLQRAGIAHADLQHGNVLLVPDGGEGKLLLKLIDYDGMYVPALAGQKSNELGHPNYQHPRREATGAYNAELDRFPHLVICCALRCLVAGGSRLWERFNTDENVLFTAQNFAHPKESKLLHELWTLRNVDAKALVGHLILAIQSPLEQTPLLDDLLKEGRPRPLTTEQQEKILAVLSGHSPSPADNTSVAAPRSPDIVSLAETTLQPPQIIGARPHRAISRKSQLRSYTAAGLVLLLALGSSWAIYSAYSAVARSRAVPSEASKAIAEGPPRAADVLQSSPGELPLLVKTAPPDALPSKKQAESQVPGTMPVTNAPPRAPDVADSSMTETRNPMASTKRPADSSPASQPVDPGIVTTPTPVEGGNLLFADSFSDVAGAVRTTGDGKQHPLPASRAAYPFHAPPDDGALTMDVLEDNRTLGPDGKPGVLAMSWTEVPLKVDYTGFFYQGGTVKEDWIFPARLQTARTVNDLRGLRLRFRHRSINSVTGKSPQLQVFFMLETHGVADGYLYRVDFGPMHANGNWQTSDFALIDGENLDKFLEMMADKKPEAFRFVWTQVGPITEYHAGDTLLIDDISIIDLGKSR